MKNFIIIAIIVVILTSAVLYIQKQKKKGVRCIGCPDGTKCAGTALREQAAAIPQQMAGCIPLSTEDATELYRLLYKILENSR